MKQNKRIFTVWDTETTGLQQGIDRILEIAFVTRDLNGNTIDEYHQLINPEMPISAEAYNVHKIGKKELEGKPRFKDIYKDIIDYLIRNDSDELAAYNSDFDTTMLSFEFKNIYNETDKISYPTPFDYIKQKYPDFIPYCVRKYVYDKNTDTYSYTGTPIKNLTEKDLFDAPEAVINLFPCVDLMLPLVHAKSQIDSTKKQESLDAISNIFKNYIEQSLGESVENNFNGNQLLENMKKRTFHSALVDTHITADCYNIALNLHFLEKPVLELEHRFSGAELQMNTLTPELKIPLNISQQMVSLSQKKLKRQNDLKIKDNLIETEVKPSNSTLKL